MNSQFGCRGAFITVEGADGAGKTTQLGFIESWLQRNCVKLVRTREPGGTPFGEKLRDILLDSAELEICDEAELLTVFAARKQHLHTLIEPTLASGCWVLSDRFTDASYAYQGAGRGINPDRIAILENWVQGDLQPDLTIVLDIDVAQGAERSGARSGNADRFEREAVTFKTAVRECYLDRARVDPNRIRVVDASGSIERVQQQIDQILSGFLASRVQILNG